MSYARPDATSDVHILNQGESVACCNCRLGADFSGSRPEMLAHLEAHRAAGHRVPDDCVQRLEIEARSGERTIGGAVRATLHDWAPETRGTCTCGHSWLFHWLRAPHKCNDCPECTGYVCGKARGA